PPRALQWPRDARARAYPRSTQRASIGHLRHHGHYYHPRRYRVPIAKFARSALLTVGAFECAQATAADCRALDFIASCDSLPALEAARGSQPFEERLPSGFQFAFRGRELDRDVVIGYACRDGRFFRGAYIFAAKDEADASALYKVLKQRVTRERGAPTYDFA